jgi:DNA modification methylase
MPAIEQIPIAKLKHYERNPRKITTDQFAKLCDSIQVRPDFFERRPALVNKTPDGTLTIYAGNQRVRAAKKLKLKSVPCIVDENLTEEEMKQRIVLDNVHHGEFDYDILAADFDPAELLSLGMTEKDLHIAENIESNEIEEDSDVLTPGDDKDAITKPGDCYELNNHRLYCGDSTLPDSADRCLNGNTPILMVTDPPYGVEYDPNWRGKAGKGQKAAGKVKNDDNINWALAWHLFPGSIAYIWCASWYLPEVAKTLEECEFERKSLIIWAKQHFALSRGDYHWQHEPCWYAVKKGCEHNWQGSRKESTIWEISNLNAFGKSKEEGEERTAHSTQKPIECMAKPIINNTAKGDGVYDPFLGSGTTLIAAEQLDRVCYGIELSPAYCDLIVARWRSYMEKHQRPFTIKRNGEPFNG